MLPHPVGITIFEDHIYVTDFTKLGVLSANKYDGSELTLATSSGLNQPNFVVSYHPVRQPEGESFLNQFFWLDTLASAQQLRNDLTAT